MQLIPNKVLYENFTAIDGEKIEFGEEAKLFLEQRGHIVSSLSSAAAVSQLVVHNLQVPVLSNHRKDNRKVKNGNNIFHGKLIAISDPRKDGSPAGL